MKKFELATNKVKAFRFYNLKSIDSVDTVESLVRFVILRNQYDSILKGLPIETFEEKHPGANFWTAEEKDFAGIINTEDVADVIEERNNALTVKAAIDKLPAGLEAYNALSDVDKYNVIIEAHKSVPAVCLPKAAVDKLDLKKAVSEYYAGGIARTGKDCMRAAFMQVLGMDDGVYFAPVKFARSEFGCSDVLNFLASFGGKAARKERKTKAGKVLGNYDYTNKCGWKQKSAAVTTLLGVMLESRHDQIEVVK